MYRSFCSVPASPAGAVNVRDVENCTLKDEGES